MSATNRGAVRRPHDNYPTPAWAVHRLLDEVQPPGMCWLEPCAGDGAIIRAVWDWQERNGAPLTAWRSYEIRAECRTALRGLGRYHEFRIADFLRARNSHFLYDAVITNPPFSLAYEFARKACYLAPWVALLLRVGFCETPERTAWLRQAQPSLYILPNRPSFTGKGTDAATYAWFVFDQRGGPSVFKVLNQTPQAVRCPRRRRREA